jgi:Cu-Zn family superoxide dismutase
MRAVTRVKVSAWATAAVLLGSGMVQAQSTPKSVTVQMETSDGRDGGKATLMQSGKAVKVQADFKNLNPGVHAIHIHQNPKCDAPDFKTAGGHFNPTGKQHGIQNPQGHHAGDMPINLNVGDDGMVKKTFTTKDVTLDPKAANSVFANGGTSLMVHAGADDMKSDPAGNAGGREACGIISIKNASGKSGHGFTGSSEGRSNH